jgi:hypothetical protein
MGQKEKRKKLKKQMESAGPQAGGIINGGVDPETGQHFIDFGPHLKLVWAVIVDLGTEEGEGKGPFKLFKGNTNKHKKRAKDLKNKMRKDLPMYRWSILEIFTATEREERDIRYGTKEEIENHLEEFSGRQVIIDESGPRQVLEEGDEDERGLGLDPSTSRG